MKVSAANTSLRFAELAVRHGLRAVPVFTGVALLSAALFLGATSVATGDIARAFWLGTFVSTLAVAILLAVTAKVTVALRRVRERFALALDISNDGFWEWNIDTGEMQFSDRWCDTLGYTPAEITHRAEFRVALMHPDDTERAHEQMLAHLDGASELHQCEQRLRAKSGDYQWKLTRAKVVARDGGGRPLRVLGVDLDITRLHRLSEQVSYQASHDTLTGLVNRREFERRLRVVIDRTHLQPAKHALLVLDLDQFTVINETCGHDSGDELLCRVAKLLKRCLRQRDTIARLGGDEFGILIEHCAAADAQRTANLLVESLERCKFDRHGESFRIGACVGVASLTQHGLGVSDALQAADAACQVAKQQGRGRVHMHTQDDASLAQRSSQMQWVSRINRALDNDSFQLYYQPIIDVRDPVDLDTHYELLLRMCDETGDIIPPGAFLPAAELYNLSPKLDRWVIEHALDWLRRHPEHLGRLHTCAINLSGHSLASDGFLDFVLGRIRDSGVPHSKLCLEITETAAIANLEAAGRFINTLREHGCRFALDDFGSGLSSFAYLKNLPVDYLKIDGMFVKDIIDDPSLDAMVRAINDVGQVMGKKTVAEFVENDAILSRLRQIGVDHAQGYGISRPRPLHELLTGSIGEPSDSTEPVAAVN